MCFFRHKDLSTDEKGDKMSIIFAMASIILVYPILSALPLRLTAKQRFLIVGISLIISITGILALDLLATWQALLLMVALAFLVTILISKRIPEEEVKTVETHIQESRLGSSKDMIEEDSVIVKTISNKENELADDVNFEEEEGLEELVSMLQFDTQVTSSKIDEDEIKNEEIEDYLNNELQSHLYVAASVGSDIEDVIDHENVIELNSVNLSEEFEDLKELEGFNDRKELNEDKASAVMDTSSYLSEIEKLLLEEENDSLLDIEDKPMQKVEEKEQSTKEFKLDKLY
jgi:hypothetical protein